MTTDPRARRFVFYGVGLIALVAFPFLGVCLGLFVLGTSLGSNWSLIAMPLMFIAVGAQVWGTFAWLVPTFGRLVNANMTPDWGNHPTTYGDIFRLVFLSGKRV